MQVHRERAKVAVFIAKLIGIRGEIEDVLSRHTSQTIFVHGDVEELRAILKQIEAMVDRLEGEATTAQTGLPELLAASGSAS